MSTVRTATMKLSGVVQAVAPTADATPVVKAVEPKSQRGRGRPPVFTGLLEKNIVKVVRELGLTKGRTFLATTGVQINVGWPCHKVKISLPTLGKLASRHGVSLKRGRPSLEAA